jgi:CBS domain containing-hemolysin-like protein
MADSNDAVEPSSGRTFWSSLRNMLFGDDSEATLREEIEEAIDSHEGEAPMVGDLTPVERQMLRNLLHFGDRTAADVAVPRSDIIAVPASISFEGLLAAFADAGHSRLPVYEDSLDSVIGMVHIKDVFTLQETRAAVPDDIRSLMRAPLYVPESMGALDLLARMRGERMHLAIVVDEFGGTEGLVPIEDGIWDADARAELEEVALTIDGRLAEVEEDVDTLGGLALVLAGHVPQPGEIVAHPTGWRLEITQGDTRRVHRMRLHAPETVSVD